MTDFIEQLGDFLTNLGTWGYFAVGLIVFLETVIVVGQFAGFGVSRLRGVSLLRAGFRFAGDGVRDLVSPLLGRISELCPWSPQGARFFLRPRLSASPFTFGES